MPVQGLVRLRKHQFGRQSAWDNAEPATRAYPFSGVPSVNLNWTDPEGDFGSLFPIAAPFRQAPDLTAALTAPVVNYNDLPLMFGGVFGNDESPVGAGTGKTWEWTPGTTTADAPDLFTYQFFDDTSATDAYQFLNGILTQLQFSTPDTGGPVSASMQWLFSKVNSTGSTDSPVDGTVPTAGLSVASSDIVVYAKDMSLFIDTAVGSLGATQIVDALHSFELTITREIDQKRWINGSQSFEVAEYGVAGYRIELALTFGKTADTIGTGSESDAWMSDDAVNRFVRISAESTAVAETGTPDIPYSWVMDLPLRYYTREEGNIGGNTTIVLSGATYLQVATLNHAFETTVVNTLAGTSLES